MTLVTWTCCLQVHSCVVERTVWTEQNCGSMSSRAHAPVLRMFPFWLILLIRLSDGSKDAESKPDHNLVLVLVLLNRKWVYFLAPACGARKTYFVKILEYPSVEPQNPVSIFGNSLKSSDQQIEFPPAAPLSPAPSSGLPSLSLPLRHLRSNPLNLNDSVCVCVQCSKQQMKILVACPCLMSSM